MSRNDSDYHKLLNTTRWRSLRAAQLSAYPFCADCAKEGVITPADEVHHNIPVEFERNPDRMVALAYDRGNLVSLCHSHHVQRHKEMRSHSVKEKEARLHKEADAFWDKYR
jgi:hypothetical protein